MKQTPQTPALRAVATLRAVLDDPAAQVAVIAPSAVAIDLLRPPSAWARIEWLWPAAWVRRLAIPGLAARRLRPEPAGWTAAVSIIDPHRLPQARRDAGIASPDDLHDAALAGLAAGPSGFAGAVVVGDAALPAPWFELLHRWLGLRPAVVVTPRVEVVPRGLRAAAGEAPIQWADPSEPAPDAMCGGHRQAVAAALADAVLETLTEGVSGDRVAVVVDDRRDRPCVLRALRDAGLTQGGPLAECPPAQGLRMALRIASAPRAATAQHWLELVRAPGLRLRAAWPQGPTGQSQWRSALAAAGVATGGRRIAAQLEASGEPAARALAQLIAVLDAELRALPRRAGLDEHGRGWAGWLRRWWPPDADRQRVINALDAWGSTPAIPIEGAAQVAEQALMGAVDPVNAAVHLVASDDLVAADLEAVFVFGDSADRAFARADAAIRWWGQVHRPTALAASARAAAPTRALIVDVRKHPVARRLRPAPPASPTAPPAPTLPEAS